MRRVRTILGIAVAVCAFGTLASSALAAEEVTFGEFVTNIPGQKLSVSNPGKFASKEGSVSELKLAATPIECEGLKGTGESTVERSSSLSMVLQFKKCEYSSKEQGGRVVPHKLHFNLPITFHSNGGALFGVEDEIGPAVIGIRASNTPCQITIPRQPVPVKVKPEGSEDVVYSTEFESVSGKKKEELFPLGQERLEIDLEELKGIQTTVHTEPGGCGYVNEAGSKFNKETGNIEYGGGVLEGELDEIVLKKGNIGFAEPE